MAQGLPSSHSSHQPEPELVVLIRRALPRPAHGFQSASDSCRGALGGGGKPEARALVTVTIKGGTTDIIGRTAQG